MFPVIHGILAQAQEGTSVCKYPLDKTDFSDIEQTLGMPVLPVEFLDGSMQKFRIPSGDMTGAYVAAPEGFVIGLATGDPQFPNRGTLGNSAVYAIKIKIDGELDNFVNVPVLYVNIGEAGYLPTDPYRIVFSGGVLGIRATGISDLYPLPNEFTLITVFSTGNSKTDSFTYIPEIDVVLSRPFGGMEFSGEKFGFLFTAWSINVDYTVELVTDKAALENLIGDFDIPAATGVTEVETICGQPLDLSPIEPAGG